MLAISPLKARISLREQALAKIRDAIILGQLPPGSLSSEQTIADQLEISRTPIREALLQLESEGLVEFVPNRGVRVTTPHIDHLAQMYTLRIGIEGYCAMLLARRSDRKRATDALEQALTEQRRIIDAADHQAWVAANMDFHVGLVEACGNPLMTDAVRNVASHGMRIGYSINDSVRNRMEQSLVEHRHIVRTIRAGDPDEAFRSVESHLTVTTALMRRLMNPSAAD